MYVYLYVICMCVCTRLHSCARVCIRMRNSARQCHIEISAPRRRCAPQGPDQYFAFHLCVPGVLRAGNTNEANVVGLRLLGRAAAKFELPRTSWSRANLGDFSILFLVAELIKKTQSRQPHNPEPYYNPGFLTNCGATIFPDFEKIQFFFDFHILFFFRGVFPAFSRVQNSANYPGNYSSYTPHRGSRN